MNDNRIHEKLDKITEDINDIKVTMAKNTASLDYHIKRTDDLEMIVKKAQKAVFWIEGAMKLLGAIGFLIGAVAGLVKIFG